MRININKMEQENKIKSTSNNTDFGKLNYMNLDKIIVSQIICYLLFLNFLLLMIVSVKDKNITQYILEFYKRNEAQTN
jgi:hypothetical protein